MRYRIATLCLLVLAAVSAAPALHAETARERAQKLMKTLAKDRDAGERAEAARMLGEMGATDSVPALAKALSDDERTVRASAAAALWKLGDVSKPAMPELKKAFDRGPGWVRLNAGGALEALGADRKELVEGYRELLTSNDVSARVEAARRLQGQIPDDELLPVVQEALDHKEVRSDAQEVLRHLSPKKKEGASALSASLVSNLHHRDSSVRSDAAYQLGRMKPVPRDAVPAIVDLLGDSETSVRRAACSALGSMGKTHAAASVKPLVTTFQKDEEVEIRVAAAHALAEIGQAAKEAIPAFTVALKDKEPKIREAACEGLQGMGTLARSAIPALEAAQKDEDGFVRGAAWRALLRVDPKK